MLSLDVLYENKIQGKMHSFFSRLCMVGFVRKIDTRILKHIGLNPQGQICCGPGAVKVHKGLSRQNVSDSFVNSGVF